MAGDTLTLVLSGDVTLADFSKAVAGLQRLVRGLSSEVSPETKLVWTVDALEAGSAITTVRGVARNGRGPVAVEKVARAYIMVGEALQRGDDVPFSPKVQRPARALTTVLKRSVEAIRFETPEADATVTRIPKDAGVRAPWEPRVTVARGAYGAVEGRVQPVSNRGGLRFTLYAVLDDRAVSCYLVEGQDEIMRHAWGRRAVIEGWVTRDPTTGHPQTVRRISAVHVVPEPTDGGFRAARGILPVDSPDLAPEIVIRRLRDA